MIREVILSNFKCFEKLRLPCASLNLLCGLNGMGKSSVIQSLLVLRQSFDLGNLREGRLVLGGELTDLGTGDDVLFTDAEQDAIGFELHHGDHSEACELWFDYSKTADQLQADMDRFLLPEKWHESPPFGGNLIYVNAERIGPRKSHPHSESMAHRRDLGAHGEYAMNFLNAYQHQLLGEDDPRRVAAASRQLRDVVNHWLQEVSPGVHLGYETIKDADAIVAGFSFDRQGDVTTRRYRPTNVGFGLSYALPVVLGLLADPGSLCLIENPEAHLHPRGQTKLAELAVRASVAGVQVIAETHSDHFMDGVRIAVREGLTKPEDVAFHYFELAAGRTAVASPRIDADGRLSTWPEGFFDQHEENLAKLLAPNT